MAYPIDDLTNVHLNDTTDDPSQARAELDACVLKVKAMIAATGTGASEALKLDSNGNLPASVGVNVQTNLPIVSTGAENIYEVALGLSAYEVGRTYTFMPHQTNTYTPFLNFDGINLESINSTHNKDAGIGAMYAGMVRKDVPLSVTWDGIRFIAVNPQTAGQMGITFDLSDTGSTVVKGQTFSLNQGRITFTGQYANLEGEFTVSSLGTLTTTAPLYLMVKANPPQNFPSMPNVSGGDGGIVTSFNSLVLPQAGALTLECQSSFFRIYSHNSTSASTRLLISALQVNSNMSVRAQYALV